MIEAKVDKPEQSSNSAKKKMEIEVEVLQQILDSNKGLQTTVEELQKNYAALEKIASQTRLQEAKASQEVDKRPRVHFKRLPQGVVIGWPDAKNPLQKDDIIDKLIINPQTNVAMGEMIKRRYYLVDGSKTDMVDYLDFVRCTDLVFGRLIQDLGDSAIIEFEDKSVASKPVEIKKVFFNA